MQLYPAPPKIMADQLATLPNFKAYLNIADTVSDAILTRLLSASSSFFLSAINRKSILLNTYTDIRHGGNAHKIILLNFPVVSVVSVSICGNPQTQSPDGVQAGWWFDQYGVGMIGSCFPRGQSNVTIVYTSGFAPNPVGPELQTIPSVAPYQLTALNATQPFSADAGVTFFSNGAALVPVSIAPAEGQYYANSSGVYLFSSADAGRQVQLNYTVAGVPDDVQQAVIEIAAYKNAETAHLGIASAREGNAIVTSYSGKEISNFAQQTINKYKRVTMVPL